MTRFWGSLLVVLLSVIVGLVLHRETGLGPDLGWERLKDLLRPGSDQDPDPVQVKSVEQRVSEAWENIIRPPTSHWKRVAVGVNSCVDVVVSGVALLEALGLQPWSGPGSGPGSGSGLDHEVLDTLEDLRETFVFSMSRGAAAERFFSDQALFQTIAKTALQIPGAKLYVGGNAALIGQKLASSDDTEVLLSGPVGPKLHELLDERIVVPPESLQETDQYHLILEYQTGEHWGSVMAPQANRFIFSHDEDNGQMWFLESLVESLEEFSPGLVVLSGLHMMEGLGPDARNQRLDQVRTFTDSFELNVLRLFSDCSVCVQVVALLSQLSVPIHLELASMTDPVYMKRIVEKVFPLVSSLGLNEQELLFLSRSLGGPHSEFSSWSEVGASSPSAVRVSSDVLLWVLRRFGSVSGAASRLSRLHFHSLPFHVVATVTGRWGNQAASSAAGARTASAQACGRTRVHAHEAQLRAPLVFNTNQTHTLTLDPDRPITEWTQHHVTLHLSPVLVCKQPIRTVGLGDAISANGLLFSEILLQE